MNRRNFLMTVAAAPLSDQEKEQFLLRANVVKKKAPR